MSFVFKNIVTCARGGTVSLVNDHVFFPEIAPLVSSSVSSSSSSSSSLLLLLGLSYDIRRPWLFSLVVVVLLVVALVVVVLVVVVLMVVARHGSSAAMRDHVATSSAHGRILTGARTCF